MRKHYRIRLARSHGKMGKWVRERERENKRDGKGGSKIEYIRWAKQNNKNRSEKKEQDILLNVHWDQ